MSAAERPTGLLAVAQSHARACWDVLQRHCQHGYCGCHLDVGGSAHILHGCEMGRVLNEEYAIACRRVRELSPKPKLEFGDLDPAPISTTGEPL